jgi:hypothetical protein
MNNQPVNQLVNPNSRKWLEAVLVQCKLNTPEGALVNGSYRAGAVAKTTNAMESSMELRCSLRPRKISDEGRFMEKQQRMLSKRFMSHRLVGVEQFIELTIFNPVCATQEPAVQISTQRLSREKNTLPDHRIPWADGMSRRMLCCFRYARKEGRSRKSRNSHRCRGMLACRRKTLLKIPPFQASQKSWYL